MISEITKLFALVCILSAGNPRSRVEQLFDIVGSKEHVESMLLDLQRQPWNESLELMQHIINNYVNFVNWIYNLCDSKSKEAESQEKKDAIKCLNGGLHLFAKKLEGINDNELPAYLIFQGIAVERPEAREDFVRECTLEAMVALLLNSGFWGRLPSWKENFKNGMNESPDFAAKFNKIRSQIEEKRPDLLPTLNALFNLPAE